MFNPRHNRVYHPYGNVCVNRPVEDNIYYSNLIIPPYV